MTNNINNGDDIVSWFDSIAEKAGEVQTEMLRKILEQNYGVEYLTKYLGDTKVYELEGSAMESIFKSLVPLVSHADIEPYVQRIADGDTSPLLTQQRITTLSLSSGTTEGRQKYVPFTSHNAQTTLQIFRLAAAYRSRVYQIKEGGKILEFIYSSEKFKTKGGILGGTATTHYYASDEFKIKQEKTKSFTCSPQEVISGGGDYKQSIYCHLLLGLFFSDQVEFITSTFAYSMVQAFTTFEELWRELCIDVKQGTLSSRITTPKMRKAVLRIISSNTDLGSRIEKICTELESVDWFGLVPKMWPNAKYLYSIMTGSMQPYMKKLRHYAGDLALVSGDYGSTESWIGVNLDPCLPPEEVTFAVIPTFAYFEFIPVHRRKKRDYISSRDHDDLTEDEPVSLSQVKIGQEYEVVLTTFTGLYRYRLGDIVEVSGFYKGTPKLNFICRRKLILTVNIDKNTEKDLQLVVEKGSQLLNKARGAELIDFTSHADVVNQPGHYIIYWEIKGEVEDKVLNECCKEMDASFMDHGYVVSRKSNSIGPLELRIVERGSFKKILDYFVGNGATLSQFKTPRCTSNQVLLKILNLCTVKRFHSTAYS
ncbi:hypothetical protein ACFE04_018479 [Oxalis oulophora]